MDHPPSNSPRPSHPAVTDPADPDRLLRQCSVRHVRGSGPGGQHRNKTQTGVQLTHQPTGITAAATERRSQAENLAVALFRLRVNLALEHRGGFDLMHCPSDLWRSRCTGRRGLIALNPGHDDFPSMLAEALEVLDAVSNDPRRAGELLGCSATQIVKLLRHDPRALAQVNRRRAACGHHPLR